MTICRGEVMEQQEMKTGDGRVKGTRTDKNKERNKEKKMIVIKCKTAKMDT